MIRAPTGYGSVARGLHWLILALLIVQFGVAWTMPDVTRETKPVGLIAWHMSIGTVILSVMLLRLVWRASNEAPPPPADLPRSLQVLSRMTHFLLYAILIVLPLLGWINASSRGWTVRLFGVIPLPPLAPVDSSWGHDMGDVHQLVAWALLAVAALHIFGALYHEFILKDDLLQRMLPDRR